MLKSVKYDSPLIASGLRVSSKDMLAVTRPGCADAVNKIFVARMLHTCSVARCAY